MADAFVFAIIYIDIFYKHMSSDYTMINTFVRNVFIKVQKQMEFRRVRTSLSTAKQEMLF